ncbi:unnamed protein product [Oreochromis niloticus]|nr:unnamed protein product [Mustela putorius furo]
MKTPSVSLLLVAGGCVLLLFGVTFSAAYVPSYSSVWPVVHLMVFLPYAVSTLMMVSIEMSRLNAGRPLVVSMETARLDEETQEFGEDYDDITADVTTEHDF